ncbi:MAG: SDR family NAD(P)-dependent oxidoreductase [Saprospiraceae bacterium]|nr:SDR family NAD(P)-dependent oxidoreductase [Saprospiraceae bacterium]
MKTAFITGISRGIGKAIAEHFLREGYQVIGTSTSGQSPIRHDACHCLALTLDQSAAIKAAIQYVADQESNLNVLVNNAAILLEDWSNPTIDMDFLRRTFAVNTIGTVELTEGLLPFLVPKQSHIINMSSGWGSFSEEGFGAHVPHYKMSKAALNMYTKLLAERLRVQGIKVSALDPGWVKSDMGTQAADRHPAEVAQEILNLLHDKPSGHFWHRDQIRSW